MRKTFPGIVQAKMERLTISEKTRISELIKANPLVIDALVEFNPHFSKLRNPILRNLLARRVSISDACTIAGCKLSEFLDKMVSIGFETEATVDMSVLNSEDHMTSAIFTAGLKVIELDVRPVLAQGEDPLKLILQAGKELKADECLKIINTFEPVPLINLLSKKGYKSWTERPGADTVYTWFVRDESGQEISDVPEKVPGVLNTKLEFEKVVASFNPEKIRTIDVRGLEMPLPMITILENLTRLKDGEALFVFHKKVPVYLLPELKERGFRYFIEDSPDGKINMLICK